MIQPDEYYVGFIIVCWISFISFFFSCTFHFVYEAIWDAARLFLDTFFFVWHPVARLFGIFQIDYVLWGEWNLVGLYIVMLYTSMARGSFKRNFVVRKRIGQVVEIWMFDTLLVINLVTIYEKRTEINNGKRSVL